MSEIEMFEEKCVFVRVFASHQILKRFGDFSSSVLITRSLNSAKIVLRGSRTLSGYVIFPPLEPYPKIRTV